MGLGWKEGAQEGARISAARKNKKKVETEVEKSADRVSGAKRRGGWKIV